MNYNKIKLLCNEQNISFKDLCYTIELTEQGLNQSIRNKSLRIDVLEKIANHFKVPISYFFEEGNEPSCAVKKTDSQTSRIEQLMIENSALKDEIIKLYKKLTP